MNPTDDTVVAQDDAAAAMGEEVMDEAAEEAEGMPSDEE